MTTKIDVTGNACYWEVCTSVINYKNKNLEATNNNVLSSNPSCVIEYQRFGVSTSNSWITKAKPLNAYLHIKLGFYLLFDHQWLE